MTGRTGAAGLTTTNPPIAVSLLTLEVRWILPGPCPDEMTRWFHGFPITTETRDDLYLVRSPLLRASVKIRGSTLLELKLEQRDARILDVPGLATAGVRSCHKWSFPLRVADGLGIASDGEWRRVRKARQLGRFCAAGKPTRPEAPRGNESAECELELTDVQVDGQAWWTLALEATGPPAQAWDAMKATAVAVFADFPLGGVRFSPSYARPYSAWLRSLYAGG